MLCGLTSFTEDPVFVNLNVGACTSVQSMIGAWDRKVA